MGLSSFKYLNKDSKIAKFPETHADDKTIPQSSNLNAILFNKQQRSDLKSIKNKKQTNNHRPHQQNRGVQDILYRLRNERDNFIKNSKSNVQRRNLLMSNQNKHRDGKINNLAGNRNILLPEYYDDYGMDSDLIENELSNDGMVYSKQ